MKISEIPSNTFAAKLSDDELDELEQALSARKNIGKIIVTCQLEQIRRGGRVATKRKKQEFSEDRLKRQLRRQKALQRLKEIYLEPAKSRGRNAKKMSEKQMDVTLKTLEIVNGFADGFTAAAKTAATNQDVDFFRAVVLAMEKMEAPRKGETKTQKHIRLALSTFLNLEKSLDRLPTKYEIVESMAACYDDLYDEDSDWNHVWKESELSWLKMGKPKEYKRNRAFGR
jgi:hypothetical protein